MLVIVPVHAIFKLTYVISSTGGCGALGRFPYMNTTRLEFIELDSLQQKNSLYRLEL